MSCGRLFLYLQRPYHPEEAHRLETPRIDTEREISLMQPRDNFIERDLYLFWGMHPRAKFSKPIISYVLDCNKRELEILLQTMVEAGLVETNIQNGVTLYSLTTNEEKRRLIQEYARHGHNFYSRLLCDYRNSNK